MGKTRRRARNKPRRGGSLCSTSFNRNAYNVSRRVNRNHNIYQELHDDHIVVKKIGPAPHLTRRAIQMEIDITREAGEMGVGPRVFYTRLCDDEERGEVSGFIVMEKIEGFSMRKPNEMQLREIKALMAILNRNGIKHGDIHSGNFIYGTTASNPEKRVYLIDYGESRYSRERNQLDFNTWYLH